MHYASVSCWLFFPVRFASAQTQNPIKSLILERQARHFLSLIRDNSSLSEDLQINNYVSDLAKEIAKIARMDSDPLHYFVVNDSSINAFAGPGATFFINTGIIELAETEGELASVITHELAHYKQKHLSRLFSDYKATQLPTLVAILAGIVVGGDTGIAAISRCAGGSSRSTDRLHAGLRKGSRCSWASDIDGIRLQPNPRKQFYAGTGTSHS